jgi:hypothetical protein
MKDYYVYMHIKMDNGHPFYIGKGREDRHTKKKNRSDFWNSIVKKHGYDIILLESGLSEKEAFEKEIYWINRIGRRDLGNGPLVNFTDGGEGASGRKLSEEHKDKIRKAVTGLKRTEEHKLILSKLKKGSKMEVEAIEKMRLKKIGISVNGQEIEYKGNKYSSIKEMWKQVFSNEFKSYQSFHQAYISRGIDNILNRENKGNNRIVLNLETGIYYSKAKDAFNNHKLNFKYASFINMLSGHRINRTSFTYV